MTAFTALTRASGTARKLSTSALSPLVSVNLFPSRRCNFECKFCFHTAKSSIELSIANARRGLQMLKEAGTEKVNIAGGEPFMRPRFLGQLVEACADLDLVVSIISNGSLIKHDWMRQHGQHISVLGVSCDSFDEATNAACGRHSRAASRRTDARQHAQQFEHALRVREWCDEASIKYKLNSVVNTLNWQEDMNAGVARLDPFRWKVFQCLLLEGENAGVDALRDAAPFVVSDEQFASFVHRHSALSPVVEANSEMRSSYVLIDEQMRFLNCADGRKVPTASILDVGVWAAFAEAGFDADAFVRRGGVYDWARERPPAPETYQAAYEY